MTQHTSRQRGAALILVLWLVAALSLTVLAGARGMRQQSQRAAFDLERLRIEPVLDAARQLAVQSLLKEGSQARGYRVQQLQLGPYGVELEIIPSAGLVDVNVASDALLQALLEKVGGLTSGEAAIMASRIRDYLDPDDEPGGIGGAEAPQYRAAGWPVLPRNGALDDLSELRMVLGMTPELYEIIAPFLGINGQQRIAIDAAPPALIDALTGQPGLGAQIQSSPPEMRAGALLSGVAAQFFTTARAGGGTIRVRATVQADQGHWWQREAWVDLSTRPDSLTPWTTLTLEPMRRMNPSPQETHP